MSKMLLVGNDLRLLATRAAVLSKTGAAVICCNAAEAAKLLGIKTFDIVVLCHSLSPQQIGEITKVLRQWAPQTKILMVVSHISQERFYGGSEFDATSSAEPARLVNRASELLAMRSNHGIDEPMRRSPTQAV